MRIPAINLEGKGEHITFEEIAIMHAAGFAYLKRRPAKAAVRFKYDTTREGQLAYVGEKRPGTYSGPAFTVDMANSRGQNCTLMFIVPGGRADFDDDEFLGKMEFFSDETRDRPDGTQVINVNPNAIEFKHTRTN